MGWFPFDGLLRQAICRLAKKDQTDMAVNNGHSISESGNPWLTIQRHVEVLDHRPLAFWSKPA